MSNDKNIIRVAFYKNGEGVFHSIIRLYTGSIYSHAELVMPDGVTWITLSPVFNSRVTPRIVGEYDEDKWDFIDLPLSWRQPVREYQEKQLKKFIEETSGNSYDWAGMLLSHLSPFKIRRANRWYCSEWIAHALLYSRIVMWDEIKMYNIPDMSPGRLHDLLENCRPKYR
jgi:hypothetical protein